MCNSFNHLVTYENEHPDDYILKLLPTRDGEAMELMFRKYFTFLCQTIARVLKDGHTSEDLAQEVLMEVWRRRADLHVSTSLKAYLRRSAVNKTLNYIRDRKIRWDDEDKLLTLPNKTEEIVSGLEGQDLEKTIHAAIDDLPERCRLVFTLSRFEEMSNQQIADELGISIKTVENQMTKALKLLREAISPYMNEG